MIKNFNFNAPVRIVFGVGTLDKVGEECTQLGAKKVMLVVDRNIVDGPAYKKVMDSLAKAGIKPAVYSDVIPEPDEECIERGAAVLRKEGSEALIGMGGGSAIDVAKGMAVLATNPSPIGQYEGINKFSNPALPILTIPGTAGTGSEVTVMAAIASSTQDRKYVVVSPSIYAKAAILDPNVLTTLPKGVAASAAMDAITHATESYLSKLASPMSEMYSTTSLSLASRSVRDFVADRNNLEAGADMLLSSMLAGVAFSQARTGVVHFLAGAVGAKYHTPHGLTCALLLCDCLQAMASASPKKSATVARIMAPELKCASDAEYAERLPDIFRQLSADLGMEHGLGKLGVTEAGFKELIDKETGTEIWSFFNSSVCCKEFSNEELMQIARNSL